MSSLQKFLLGSKRAKSDSKEEEKKDVKKARVDSGSDSNASIHDDDEEDSDDGSDLSGFITSDSDAEIESEEGEYKEGDESETSIINETSNSEHEGTTMATAIVCEAAHVSTESEDITCIDNKNIVSGKRQRKIVTRYQDSKYTNMMIRDVPEDELSAVVDDEDPYFNERFDYEQTESSGDEEGSLVETDDSEEGYNTEDYEERDRASFATGTSSGAPKRPTSKKPRAPRKKPTIDLTNSTSPSSTKDTSPIIDLTPPQPPAPSLSRFLTKKTPQRTLKDLFSHTKPQPITEKPTPKVSVPIETKKETTENNESNENNGK